MRGTIILAVAIPPSRGHPRERQAFLAQVGEIFKWTRPGVGNRTNAKKKKNYSSIFRLAKSITFVSEWLEKK